MKKVIKVPQNIDKNTERYLGALNEMHGQTLKAINENFILVNKKLDSHTEIIGNLLEDVSVLKEDVKMVKGDIKNIRVILENKVNNKEFTPLVRKIQKLESKK